MANNIFGKTFAESMSESVNDTEKLLHEKKRNFNTQINTEPPLKFWSYVSRTFIFYSIFYSENVKIFFGMSSNFHQINKT